MTNQYKPQRPRTGVLVVLWGWEVRIWASHKGQLTKLLCLWYWNGRTLTTVQGSFNEAIYLPKESGVRQNPESQISATNVRGYLVEERTPNQKIKNDKPLVRLIIKRNRKRTQITNVKNERSCKLCPQKTAQIITRTFEKWNYLSYMITSQLFYFSIALFLCAYQLYIFPDVYIN